MGEAETRLDERRRRAFRVAHDFRARYQNPPQSEEEWVEVVKDMAQVMDAAGYDPFVLDVLWGHGACGEEGGGMTQIAMLAQVVRDRVTMQEVVERYGAKRPNARGYMCCSFHAEKTPFMRIYQDGYHCFGVRGAWGCGGLCGASDGTDGTGCTGADQPGLWVGAGAWRASIAI